MVDLINLQHKPLHNVMPDDLKIGLSYEMLDIFFTSGKEIVNTDHLQQSAAWPWRSAYLLLMSSSDKEPLYKQHNARSGFLHVVVGLGLGLPHL